MRQKARNNWSKIRNAIFGPIHSHKTGNFSLNSDGFKQNEVTENLFISHGIELVQQVHIPATTAGGTCVKNVIYNRDSGNYIILFSSGDLGLYTKGDEQKLFTCQHKILCFVYSLAFSVYTAVCEDYNIRILDNDLKELSVIPCSGEIFGIVFNSFTNEFVTHGRGNITAWCFKSATSLLIPRKIFVDELPISGDVMHFCMEQTHSEQQRCFATVKNSVFVYQLSTGDCLNTLRNLHQTEITAIMYFQPLKLLVSGSKDGTIKVWNETFSLHCLFIAHCKSVTLLEVYPYGPYLLSASEDDTLRTWGLDVRAELSCTHTKVKGMMLELGCNDFCIYTDTKLEFWTVKNLHFPFVIGCHPCSLKTSINHKIAPIPFCICNDGRVCIICPLSGYVITTHLSQDALVDAVYNAAGWVYVLDCEGKLTQASTEKNPCRIEHTWEFDSDITSIALLECDGQDRSFLCDTSLQDESKNFALLFAACHDGTVLVLNLDSKNKSVKFWHQAHLCEVYLMACNYSLYQLATASKDTTVKIWRVFPFADETLAPLFFIPSHQSLCTHMQFCCTVFCLVYQDINQASHTLTMYKTQNLEKGKFLEHDVDDDHSEAITSISACNKLQLIATTSDDSTVRIWNCRNHLVRVLQLNHTAHSVCFCSLHGDLLIAIEDNVHYIRHKEYLPARYLYQMVLMNFQEREPLKPILIEEDVDDCIRRKLSCFDKSFLRCMAYVDEIPPLEKKRRDKEKELKEKEYSMLEDLNKELNLMKTGEFRSLKHKRKRLSKRSKQTAFQNYLDLFYKRTSVEYMDNRKDDDTFAVPVLELPTPNKHKEGFFAVNVRKEDMDKINNTLNQKDFKDAGVKEKSKSLTTVVEQTAPIKHSLSVSTTYTERLKAASDLKKLRQPMTFLACNEYPCSKKVLQCVNKRSVKRVEQSRDITVPAAPDGYLPNSVVVALYKELCMREVNQEERLTEWKPKGLTNEQLAELENMKQLKSSTISDTSLTSEDMSEDISVITSEDFILSSFTSEESIPPTPSPVVEASPPPLPEPPKIVKFISRPKQVEIIKPLSPSPPPSPPPKEPTPPPTPPPPPPPSPPPPSPLPEFILQFKDTDWFKQCFPNFTNDTFPKPRKLHGFVSLLLQKSIESIDFHVKTEIMKAIFHLHSNMGFDRHLSEIVQEKILQLLKFGASVEFVETSVDFLFKLGNMKDAVILEFMVLCVLGTRPLRREILSIFKNLGLVDAKEYFGRELYTAFDVTLTQSSEQRAKLRQLCGDWLSYWKRKFQEHIASLNGRISHSVKDAKKSKDGSSGLTRRQMNSRKPKQNVEIIVLSGNFVSGAANNVTAIDVINYFCELKFEAELEAERRKLQKKRTEAKKREGDKNAVLMFPVTCSHKSLVRVGETHQSRCHPERESPFTRALDLKLPVINNKIHSLLLHVNRLTLNPFPDECDVMMYGPSDHGLVTLKYSQKYFIPAHSVAASDVQKKCN